MKVKVIAVTMAAVLASGGLLSDAHAQAVVYDPTNFGQNLQQVAKAVEQIQKMQAQIQQLKQTYDSLTGMRGLGDVFNNPALRDYLPQDWSNLYDSVQSGDIAGISGSIDGMMESTSSGTISGMTDDIRARQARKAAVDKAVAKKAFDSALKRTQQIEQLLGKINQTSDPKAIAELQARIAVEQASIANENAKLQLVSMLQQAEERMITAKSDAAWSKMMAPGNNKVPRLPANLVNTGDQ